jgi:hypothetical protein
MSFQVEPDPVLLRAFLASNSRTKFFCGVQETMAAFEDELTKTNGITKAKTAINFAIDLLHCFIALELPSRFKKIIGAPGRTRTDTGRILSPLSLPLDYGGVVAIERDAESTRLVTA